jgi:hypothetical protein
LILVLIYIVAVALIVTALAGWAANDLKTTSQFQNGQDISYATSGVMNIAVQSMRTNPLLTDPVTQNVALPFVPCWTPDTTDGPNASQYKLNGVTVAVWCSTTENLASSSTRVVTFIACQSSLNSASSALDISLALVACQQNPTLKAVVTFDDYPPGGSVPLSTQCTTWCGEGSVINSWVWANQSEQS